MFLLKRTMSPYTECDILLGCFRNLEDAQKARNFYIQQYIGEKKDDPWKGQAFYNVDLEKDVVILDNIPEFDVASDTDTVSVISSFREGFGQEVREFHTICGSDKTVYIHIARIKEIIKVHDSWPRSVSAQRIKANRLLSDARDRLRSYEYTKTVADLKKNKKHWDAEKLLLELITNSEIQNELDGLGVPDWYYVELAGIYHRRKNYTKETALLEEYSKKHGPKEVFRILEGRLNRAKERLAARKKK